MFFEENDGGVDNYKSNLQDTRWDVYVNKKKLLIKGGYSVEVLYSDGKEVFGEVVDDRVVDEGKEHDEIVPQGFGSNCFG